MIEYDQQGWRVRQWRTAGTGPGQFHLPHGITAVDGVIYVADLQNGRIQHFNLKGNTSANGATLARRSQITAAPNGSLWTARTLGTWSTKRPAGW